MLFTHYSKYFLWRNLSGKSNSAATYKGGSSAKRYDERGSNSGILNKPIMDMYIDFLYFWTVNTNV